MVIKGKGQVYFLGDELAKRIASGVIKLLR